MNCCTSSSLYSPQPGLHWKHKSGNQRRSRDAVRGGAMRLRRPVAAQRRSRSRQLHGGKKKKKKRKKPQREETNNGTLQYLWSRPPHITAPHLCLHLWCTHELKPSEADAVSGVLGAGEKQAVHHCLRRNKNGLDVEGKWGLLSHTWQSDGGQSVYKDSWCGWLYVRVRCSRCGVKWELCCCCCWCSVEVVKPPLVSLCSSGFFLLFFLEAGREALNLGFFDPAHEENQAR